VALGISCRAEGRLMQARGLLLMLGEPKIPRFRALGRPAISVAQAREDCTLCTLLRERATCGVARAT